MLLLVLHFGHILDQIVNAHIHWHDDDDEYDGNSKNSCNYSDNNTSNDSNKKIYLQCTFECKTSSFVLNECQCKCIEHTWEIYDICMCCLCICHLQLHGGNHMEFNHLQAFDLLQISLRDPAEKVQQSALQVFLPSFAAWAYELGRLEHQLVHAMLRDLEDLVKAIYICSGVGLLLTWSAASWDRWPFMGTLRSAYKCQCHLLRGYVLFHWFRSGGRIGIWNLKMTVLVINHTVYFFFS